MAKYFMHGKYSHKTPARVMKAFIALNKLTGIAFTGFPAITVEEFDKITA
jgi:hypothetical protein